MHKKDTTRPSTKAQGASAGSDTGIKSPIKPGPVFIVRAFPATMQSLNASREQRSRSYYSIATSASGWTSGTVTNFSRPGQGDEGKAGHGSGDAGTSGGGKEVR